MRILAVLLVLAGSVQVCSGQVADSYLEKWLATRVQYLDSRLSQRTFDTIGWAGSIQESLNLARASQRPVFLFTLDGHMDSGRC